MWRTVTLDEVCTLRNGRAYKKPELLSEGKYPVLRVGNFFTSGNWYYSDLELEETKYCANGDLLYAWSASFGPRIWEGGKVIYHYHIWRVDVDEKLVDRKFLFYWFEYDKELVKAASGTGTTMMHVSKGSMEKRVLQLPPIAEQQRIVAKLDSAFAEIDRAIELSTEQLKQSELLVQKLIDEKFSFEGRSVSFDFIVQSKGTGLERRANLQSPDNDFPYLKMNNITSSNALNIENYTAVNASEDEVMKYKLQEGDFLFNTRNSVELVGKTAVVHGLDSWLFNNNILRVKFIEEFNPDYVNYYFCTSEGKRQLAARKTGTTNVAAIYYKDLKTVEIPFANTNDQNSISSKIEQQIDQCSIYQHCLKEKIIQHQNLKSAILAQELQQSEAA